MNNLLLILGIVITLGAQAYVTSSYNKYKNIKTKKGISGFEVASKILKENGLDNVYVTEVRGVLSDHYDSSRKVVRLSTDIFNGTSISSVSVASHEVGHAIQDKENYSFMRIRYSLFPLVNFASYAGYIAILAGIIFGAMDLIWIGIAFEIIILLFQLVTLPVEFNASDRAKKELLKYNILDSSEIEASNKVLRAAAFTYVASVLTTLLQILRLILSFSRRD